MKISLASLVANLDSDDIGEILAEWEQMIQDTDAIQTASDAVWALRFKITQLHQTPYEHANTMVEEDYDL